MSEPFSQSTFNELTARQDELRSRLEANADYQELQAITVILARQVQPKKPLHVVTGQRSGILTTPEQREEIMATAKQHQVSTKNAAAPVKQIVAGVEKLGVEIPGSSPGTTFGGMIRLHKDWEQAGQGLWRLKSDAYAAAQTKTASHLRPAA